MQSSLHAHDDEEAMIIHSKFLAMEVLATGNGDGDDHIAAKGGIHVIMHAMRRWRAFGEIESLLSRSNPSDDCAKNGSIASSTSCPN